MDHFAKPDDELAIAQQAGELHRNFQGYTTKPESDLLGFGITSISMLQDVYIQNHKRLKDFYRTLDARELPIEQGLQLTHDDLIRRTVIMELMCQFQLSTEDLENKYHLGFDLEFNDYFESELPYLDALEADGLLKRWSDGIEVTPSGRLLIRNIAAVFDTYLRQKAKTAFSRSI
jgi:oxygen-independent coproporphyrinogen-3 oxidase